MRWWWILTWAGCAGAADDAVPPTVPPGGCMPTAWTPPPACGTGPRARDPLIPGPADPGYEPATAAAVRRHDRLFTAFYAAGMGVNTEVVVPLDATATRALLDDFAGGEGWTLPTPLGELGATWQKAAGAYAGVGIAADAFRYGVLRDEGADCAEVDAARVQLLAALDGLHRAWVITGTPGVVARGYARLEPWSVGATTPTTPLFDDAGQPLPAEKNNGTWRDDASGELPGWIWEDSCSRDMLIGWMAGLGAAWEVVAHDPTIPSSVKDALRRDAAELAASLQTVQDSGYDLEIRDADGRMTYHGILHEQSIDRLYVETAQNGFNAMLALGTVAVLAMVAQDPALDAWIADELIGRRALPAVARDNVRLIDFGVASNYSNYNMAFLGGLLAQRYLCDADARAAVADGLDEGLYDIPGRDRQPAEQGQALYDLTAALARAGGGAFWPADEPDPALIEAAMTTLRAFPAAPAWDVARVHCDDDEIAAGVCVAVDGAEIVLAEGAGRNDTLVAAHPVPFALRPPSNYHWRSNPYAVNGGGEGSVGLPSVDLRFVWWLGRWATPRPRD